MTTTRYDGAAANIGLYDRIFVAVVSCTAQLHRLFVVFTVGARQGHELIIVVQCECVGFGCSALGGTFRVPADVRLCSRFQSSVCYHLQPAARVLFCFILRVTDDIKPNTHRRRDSTAESRRVGGVY